MALPNGYQGRRLGRVHYRDTSSPTVRQPNYSTVTQITRSDRLSLYTPSFEARTVAIAATTQSKRATPSANPNVLITGYLVPRRHMKEVQFAGSATRNFYIYIIMQDMGLQLAKVENY